MKYFIANWKMNMTLKDVAEWVDGYSKAALPKDQKTIIVAPSTPHISLLADLNKNLGFELSSQDISIEEKGAHTGETGAFQLKEICSSSIVGHSERKESLETVLAKRDLCLKEGVTPIVCFVKIEDAQKLYSEGVLLAWEDPNNISQNGEYREKDSKDIEEGIESIRKTLPQNAVLIYGGSVNKNNIKTLNSIVGIDGVLVGNASLDPIHFTDIILSCL